MLWGNVTNTAKNFIKPKGYTKQKILSFLTWHNYTRWFQWSVKNRIAWYFYNNSKHV